jgi:hypothetical protein
MPQARLPDPAAAQSLVVVLRLRGRTTLGATFVKVVTDYAGRLADADGSSRMSAAAESSGLSRSTSQSFVLGEHVHAAVGGCVLGTCGRARLGSLFADDAKQTRDPTLLPSSIASRSTRLPRCPISSSLSASMQAASEPITRTRSLPRSRSAMISPWKPEWLNPGTITCTGPIAMFFPHSSGWAASSAGPPA